MPAFRLVLQIKDLVLDAILEWTAHRSVQVRGHQLIQINHLEQLIAEWYEYKGSFIRENVWVGGKWVAMNVNLTLSHSIQATPYRGEMETHSDQTHPSPAPTWRTHLRLANKRLSAWPLPYPYPIRSHNLPPSHRVDIFPLIPDKFPLLNRNSTLDHFTYFVSEW
jgi:hypothetical protein